MTTPTLTSVIRDWIDSRQVDIHTALPGKVVKYYPDRQTVDVEPQVKRALKDDDGDKVLENMPILPNVPVAFPRGGGFVMTFPLMVGDFVLVVFCERSIDTWRASGRLSDPGDLRLHDLSFGVAIPGVFPSTKRLAEPAHTTDMVIGRDAVGGTQIHIKPNGEIHLTSGNDAEFLARADRVEAELSALKDAILTTPGGAPIPAWQTALGTELTNFPGSTACDKVKGQ